MPRGRPSVTHFFLVFQVPILAVFACESTDEKTDEHLKSRRRAEQMRITDSVAMAAGRRRTRIWVGRGREEFLLTLRAKKNHAKESDETAGRTATLPSAAGGSRKGKDAHWNIVKN